MINLSQAHERAASVESWRLSSGGGEQKKPRPGAGQRVLADAAALAIDLALPLDQHLEVILSRMRRMVAVARCQASRMGQVNGRPRPLGVVQALFGGRTGPRGAATMSARLMAAGGRVSCSRRLAAVCCGPAPRPQGQQELLEVGPGIPGAGDLGGVDGRSPYERATSTMAM